jgi:hypothetical protein
MQHVPFLLSYIFLQQRYMNVQDLLRKLEQWRYLQDYKLLLTNKKFSQIIVAKYLRIN